MGGTVNNKSASNYGSFNIRSNKSGEIGGTYQTTLANKNRKTVLDSRQMLAIIEN